MKTIAIRVGDYFPASASVSAFDLAVGRGAVVVLLAAPIDLNEAEAIELLKAQANALRSYVAGMDRELDAESARGAAGGGA